MGQAKLRGTFEQRAAQAQQRAAEERAERERKEAEAKEVERQRIAALPPEQRERVVREARSHRTNVATWVALGAALAAGLPSRSGKA